MTDTSLAPSDSAKPASGEPVKEPEPVMNTIDLFRGRREICIEHEGVCYRLRITRRNKLILQK